MGCKLHTKAGIVKVIWRILPLHSNSRHPERDEILTDFAKDVEFSLDSIAYAQGHPRQRVNKLERDFGSKPEMRAFHLYLFPFDFPFTYISI